MCMKISEKHGPVPDLRGAWGYVPPEEAVSALKIYNIFHALYDIASIYLYGNAYLYNNGLPT